MSNKAPVKLHEHKFAGWHTHIHVANSLHIQTTQKWAKIQSSRENLNSPNNNKTIGWHTPSPLSKTPSNLLVFNVNAMAKTSPTSKLLFYQVAASNFGVESSKLGSTSLRCAYTSDVTDLSKQTSAKLLKELFIAFSPSDLAKAWSPRERYAIVSPKHSQWFFYRYNKLVHMAYQITKIQLEQAVTRDSKSLLKQ